MTPKQQVDDILEYAVRAWADRDAATAMILNDAANTIERLVKRIAELEQTMELEQYEQSIFHDARNTNW